MKMLIFFISNIIDDILDLDEVLLSVLFCALFFGLWFLFGIIFHIFGFSPDLSVTLGLFVAIMMFLIIPIYRYLNGIYKRYQVEESKNYVKEIERKAKKR